MNSTFLLASLVRIRSGYQNISTFTSLAQQLQRALPQASEDLLLPTDIHIDVSKVHQIIKQQLSLTSEQRGSLSTEGDSLTSLECLKDYQSRCPQYWVSQEEFTCVAPPWYNGVCGKSVLILENVPHVKRKLETDCGVSWPCLGEGRQDFTAPCPDQWVLNDTKCIFNGRPIPGQDHDINYNSGICGSELAGQSNPAYNAVVAHRCALRWPHFEPCHCDDADLFGCPLGWTEMTPSSCRLDDPSQECDIRIFDLSEMLADRNRRCFISRKCRLEWRCKRRELKHISTSDAFLRQLNSILQNDTLFDSKLINERVTQLFNSGLFNTWSQSALNCSNILWDQSQCPKNWTKQDNICIAPPTYRGPCGPYLQYPPVSDPSILRLIKQLQVAVCEVAWPCETSTTTTLRPVVTTLPQGAIPIPPTSPPLSVYGPVESSNGSVITPLSFLQNVDFGLKTRQDKIVETLKSPFKKLLTSHKLPSSINDVSERDVEFQSRIATEGQAETTNLTICHKSYRQECPVEYDLFEDTICYPKSALSQPRCPFLSAKLTIKERQQKEKQCGLHWPCETCNQDFVRTICPQGWRLLQDKATCKAEGSAALALPSDCPSEVKFSKWDPHLKEYFALYCNQVWPCFEYDCEHDYETTPCPKKFIKLPLTDLDRHISTTVVPDMPNFVGDLCVSTKYSGTCPSLLRDHPQLADQLITVTKNVLNITLDKSKLTMWIVPHDKRERMRLEDLCGVEFPCVGVCKEDFTSACPFNWTFRKNQCYPPKKRMSSLSGAVPTCESVESIDTRKWGKSVKREFSGRCQSPWPCRDSCEMDWSADCPWRWIKSQKVCRPPKWSICASSYPTPSLSFDEKKVFAIKCDAPWPCAGYTLGLVKPLFTQGRWQTDKVRTDLHSSGQDLDHSVNVKIHH